MLSRKPRYLTRLEPIEELTPAEKRELQPVCDEFLFRANDYYLSLIDWDDPEDPIRRIIMPSCDELEDWGAADPSNESKFTQARGLEHKYPDTALMLVNDVCGGYCRFCFRKRIFLGDNDETVRDTSEAIEYIRWHPEINNVLLTGGDPLLMSTRRLAHIIGQLREIDHVEVIRIGSKMPAFNPMRILDDEDLTDMIQCYSRMGRRIYLMTHFNHPRELTGLAVRAVSMLQAAGAVVCNQTPLVRGVNDDPDVLRELFDGLTAAGVAPYYVFQCRPTVGNLPYTVPVEEGYAIFLEALVGCSGLARRARYAMSHATGKIVIAGMDGSHIFMRYHRAANPDDEGRLLVLERDATACWLDDYPDAVEAVPDLWSDPATDRL